MLKVLLFFISFTLLISYTCSQWNYGTPFSTSPQQSTWQQVVSKVQTAGNTILDSLSAPYPTNAWFNLFFLHGTAYPNPQGNIGQNDSWVYPYNLGSGFNYGGYSNQRALLSINYKPFGVTTTGGSFPTVNWDNGSVLFMGTTNPANFTPVIRNDYTDLSATIKYYNTANVNQYYYAPIVRGMPYVTMFYNNVTPGIYFPSPAIWKVNDVIVAANQTFTGTEFKVQTTTGAPEPLRSQTWMIFSSQSITLQFSQNPQTLGLIGTAPLTGWIRVANLTYDNDPNAADVPNRLNLLRAYAKFIPIKGEVGASIPSGSSTAALNFNFTRYNEGSLTGDSLLMMALPHHVDMLPGGSTTNLLKYQVLKGTMSEVKTKTWQMTEQLPGYSWSPRSGGLANVPLQWCDTLNRYVTNDLVNFNRQYQWMDIYSAAKCIGKLGRIVQIADELYDRDQTRYAAMQPLAVRMRDSLQIYLGRWLNGNSSIFYNGIPYQKDSLLYDTKFRGIISSRSHDSLNLNNGIDFGSALYNDHHFHYGYLLYAAAVVAKKNPAWFTANGNYYSNRVTDLAREIANPSRGDNYFALQRYKDWYDGHSWANGLVPYGGGKNQESSSEAANAWYGLYLFGLAMNNASPNAQYSNMLNQGQLMLSQEVRSVQKYYYANQTNPVYPAVYTNQFKTVTNMYQGRIDASTFFGSVNYYATGIQVVPVTPVTEQFWSNIAFAKQIYDYTPNGLRYTPCFDSTNTNTTVWNWTTINVGVQATAYPQTALNFWKFYGYNNANFDNGSSQSNVMYWILTRNHNAIGISSISNEVPAKYNLYQSYPNPFNPVTNIKFDISKASAVKLEIYDVTGRKVDELVNGQLNAGTYNAEWNASRFSSGVYFYTLSSGDFVQTKKMILVK
ncbi:MAG: T9SS type A sorting domain-containing protein [Ignavibacteria bacterium]|nr:T9SS type A sorting domain-containing protein [Ignavibacteria bacterium]